MGFIDFLLLMGSCAWMTWLFVQATIMDDIGLRPLWEKIDFLRRLFNCSMCTGSHVGIYWGLFLYYLNTLGSFWFYVLTIPFASACVGFVYERLLFLMIEVIEGIEKRNKRE